MIGSRQNQARYFGLMLPVIVLALILYMAPWLTNPGASLSLGANDLAEWASLHPQVRAETPTMLTSLLLRLPLVCLAGIVGFTAPVPALKSRSWWIGMAFVALILIMLFPPLEFLSTARHDKNYQQQLMLVIIAFIGSLLGLSGLLSAWRHCGATLAALVGAGASLWGLQKTYTLMHGFHLPVQVGAGGMGLVIVLVGIAISSWRFGMKQGSAPFRRYPVNDNSSSTARVA